MSTIINYYIYISNLLNSDLTLHIPIDLLTFLRQIYKKPSVLTKFKHDHDLKEDAVLDLQSISNHNTVYVAGKEYSLDDLEPLNVFADIFYPVPC